MINRMRAARANDKGFTLIELLVVVVIIGVLAAIAIPIFLNQKEKAAEAGVKSDIKNASTYLETHFVDNGSYTTATVPTITTAGFKQSGSTKAFTITTTANSYCIQGNAGTGTPVRNFNLNSATGILAAGAC